MSNGTGWAVVIGRDNRSVALLAQALKELAHERDRLPRSAIRRPNRRIKGALGPALPPLLLLGTGNPERESPSSAIRIVQLLVLEQSQHPPSFAQLLFYCILSLFTMASPMLLGILIFVCVTTYKYEADILRPD